MLRVFQGALALRMVGTPRMVGCNLRRRHGVSEAVVPPRSLKWMPTMARDKSMLGGGTCLFAGCLVVVVS